MPFINVMTNSEIKDKDALKAELGNDITAIPVKAKLGLWLNLKIRQICILKEATSHVLCLKLLFRFSEQRAYENLTSAL